MTSSIADLVNIHFDLLSVGVAVTGIALLGFLIYFNNSKSATNRTFFVFSLLTMVWGVSNYLEYKFPTIQTTLWALRFHLFLSTWHAYVFFRLSYVFPRAEVRIPKWLTYVLTPIVGLTSLMTLTPLVFSRIAQLAPAGMVTNPERGPGIVLFSIVAFGLLFAGVGILFYRWRHTQSLERHQVGVFLLGMSLTAVLILLFNVFLPIALNQLSFIPLAALFLLPIIALTSYAIYRHHLFNLKVATTALLGFMVTVFTFVNVLYSTTLSGVAINLAALCIVLLGSIRILRDTLNLVEQREQIEKLSEEKSEFMSFASHEIRNPITAMRGYASLIEDGTVGGVSAQVKEVAQKILVNGDTVLSLISEYLNKSKVELGQISYTIADIDVGKTVISIAEGLKVHAREKGLSFDIRIDFPQLMAKADEPKLREVVGNLIDNSVKYTKQGGITVSVEKRNSMAHITVADTGAGIPAETISHLFQKFSRADAQKMNLLGTGLGLFLAKTFIEGMGGKIWAESDGKDKGSRFIIELHTV